ncbi:septation protein A [Methylophilales bacterium MBRSG12]|uniref:Inner membrane-spanning protein YciB n=1 Tax=Methylophilales bacterium MBRS-H7 TaxID=1623450 RepID=A0A0H4IY26_9PROT|nr:septation protein A [Methylophilales bacterium MBRSF5]AKO65444.1 septation protein A [Methylophilales bacterium MBRS-H7]AKO66764.1 septation protein A [Methylophilales bacterium MBRSG12]
MKFFIDLLPVIIFFVVYKYTDIFYATFSAIIASIFLAITTYLIKKKIEKMVLINTLLISILGGLTILLKDNTFIMWKPTAIYWLFALVLIVSQLFFKKNLMKQMLGKQVSLQDHAWNHISMNVIIFMIGIGVLNLYVAFNFDENTWVNFKLFGITFLLFIFMIYLALYISKENK